MLVSLVKADGKFRSLKRVHFYLPEMKLYELPAKMKPDS
jgi:hypothetical protein